MDGGDSSHGFGNNEFERFPRDKTGVVMETRGFSQSSDFSITTSSGSIALTSQPRKLCQIMTHVLSVLFATGIKVGDAAPQSEDGLLAIDNPSFAKTDFKYSNFTAEESTTIYFAITRLFQTPKDPSLRRLMYLALRVLATKREPARDVIMVMSSLLKELSQARPAGQHGAYIDPSYIDMELRASALRCLVDTSNPTLLVTTAERVVRELIMDANGRVASAGAVAIAHLVSFSQQYDFGRRFIGELTALMDRGNPARQINYALGKNQPKTHTPSSFGAGSALGFFSSFLAAVAEPLLEENASDTLSRSAGNSDLALAAYHAFATLLLMRQQDKQGVLKLLSVSHGMNTTPAPYSGYSGSRFTGAAGSELTQPQDPHRYIQFASVRQIKLLASKITSLSEIESLVGQLEPFLSFSKLHKASYALTVFAEATKALVSLLGKAIGLIFAEMLRGNSSNNNNNNRSSSESAFSDQQQQNGHGSRHPTSDQRNLIDAQIPPALKEAFKKTIKIIPTFLSIERTHFRLFALRILSRLSELSPYTNFATTYLASCNADLENCISLETPSSASFSSYQSAYDSRISQSPPNAYLSDSIPDFDLSLSTEYSVNYKPAYSSSATISLLAISILLKTGGEELVSRLVDTLMEYLSVTGGNIPVSMKTNIVSSIFSHTPGNKSRYASYIHFASTLLHEPGDLAFKRLLVNHLSILLVLLSNDYHKAAAAKDSSSKYGTNQGVMSSEMTCKDDTDACLAAICDYIEDCDYPEAIIPDLSLFLASGVKALPAKEGLPLSTAESLQYDGFDNVFIWCLPRPERLVRYLTNRLELEPDTIRPAALLALFQMGLFAGPGNLLYKSLKQWLNINASLLMGQDHQTMIGCGKQALQFLNTVDELSNSLSLLTFVSHFIKKYDNDLDAIALYSQLNKALPMSSTLTQLEATQALESAILISAARQKMLNGSQNEQSEPKPLQQNNSSNSSNSAKGSLLATTQMPELPLVIAPPASLISDSAIQTLPTDASVSDTLRALFKSHAFTTSLSNTSPDLGSQGPYAKKPTRSTASGLNNLISSSLFKKMGVSESLDDLFAPLLGYLDQTARAYGKFLHSLSLAKLPTGSPANILVDGIVSLLEPGILSVAFTVSNTYHDKAIYDLKFSASIATNFSIGEQVLVGEQVRLHPSQHYIPPQSKKTIFALYWIKDKEYWNESVDIPGVPIYELSDCCLNYQLYSGSLIKEMTAELADEKRDFGYPNDINTHSAPETTRLRGIKVLSDDFSSIQL